MHCMQLCLPPIHMQWTLLTRQAVSDVSRSAHAKLHKKVGSKAEIIVCLQSDPVAVARQKLLQCCFCCSDLVYGQDYHTVGIPPKPAYGIFAGLGNCVGKFLRMPMPEQVTQKVCNFVPVLQPRLSFVR